MRKSAQEVELGFDPAEDLVGWGEDFEVAETDWWMLAMGGEVGLGW